MSQKTVYIVMGLMAPIFPLSLPLVLIWASLADEFMDK